MMKEQMKCEGILLILQKIAVTALNHGRCRRSKTTNDNNIIRMKKILSIMALVAIIIATVAVPAEARKPRKKARKAVPTTQVIYTGDLASKVIGYQGTTPLTVTIKDGRVESIEPELPNKETPRYFERASKHVFAQYTGKTVSEARAVKGDVATGATYTSEALIKNIEAALAAAK